MSFEKDKFPVANLVFKIDKRLYQLRVWSVSDGLSTVLSFLIRVHPLYSSLESYYVIMIGSTLQMKKTEAQIGGVVHRRSQTLRKGVGNQTQVAAFSVSLLCWSCGVMGSPAGDRGYLSLLSAWPECWN